MRGVDADRFFAYLGADIERVQGDASDDLRDKVGTIFWALHQARDGDASGVSSARLEEARSRLAVFQRESCVGGEAGTE